MILYFTGTGNSRYAAQIIARITGDELISINDISRERVRQIEARAFEKIQETIAQTQKSQALLPPA